jgi:glycosidase
VEGIDTGIATCTDTPLAYAIRHNVLNRAAMTYFQDVLGRDWMYPHAETLVTFFDNDRARHFMSQRGAEPRGLQLAFSMLATLRGIPEIYFGDEVAMNEGERAGDLAGFPGGFPHDEHNAFESSGRTVEQQQMFAHVQRLLKLRVEHKALRDGKEFHLFVDKTGFAYVRDHAGTAAGLTGDKHEALLIVVNNSDAAREFTLDIRDTTIETALQARRILAESDAKVSPGSIQVTVPARQLVIYKVECGCDAD